jgi:hypothetical protein
MERPKRKSHSTPVRLLAAALLACVAPGLSADEPDCGALFRTHMDSDLVLAYEEFDQTPGRGFRALAMAGCSTEAADLIEAYIETNQAGQRSLRWHVAQLRATAGDYPRAVESARQVLSESEDFSARPLRWNDYVLATIAFLERDREALVRHRDRVAEGGDYPGNAMNLRLLNALVRHFDESYAYATSHIE